MFSRQKKTSPNKRPEPNLVLQRSVRIAVIYFVFGFAWILLTDILAYILASERSLQTSIVKGLIYVFTTALLMFFHVRASLNQIMETQEALRQVNEQLHQTNLRLQQESQKLQQSQVLLKRSEELFRVVFDQATIGIAIWYPDKEATIYREDRPSINEMFARIVGRTKEELAHLRWKDIIDTAHFAEDKEKFDRFLAGQMDRYETEKRYVRPDGSEVWVNIIMSPLKDYDEGQAYLCLVEDITKRKELEMSMMDSERSKTVLLDNLPGIAYRCLNDQDWTMLFVSQGCKELTGYPAESLLHNKELSFNDLIAPTYRQYLRQQWDRILAEGGRLSAEYEIITASGQIKWVFEQGQGIYDENGQVVALEGLIIDITERKRHEILLKYINEHDPISGLYNRRYFYEVIKQHSQKEPDIQRAALLINLRKFNLLIMTFGYYYGETLITELSGKLSALCKGKPFQLFHISMDRFILYLTGYRDREELIEWCERVVQLLEEEFSSSTFGGNVGVLEFTSGSEEAEAIIKKASIAADNVDESVTFGYQFFDASMEEYLLRKAIIKREMDTAAYDPQDQSLQLVYQPIVDVKNGNICCVEALVRFHSPTLGTIRPDEFIPICEESQLIVPLGKKIMQQGFRFLKRLDASGFNQIAMSINISAIQLLQEGFVADLKRMIAETGIDPSRLILEITESIFTNNYKALNQKLTRIQKLGIKIAIDDFGTGYSSLARERELNSDYLKLDKYFVDHLGRQEPCISGDIISMAHKLGQQVIAEGVETEAQKAYLIEHHCDYMQGYLFSKPISEDQVIELLQQSPDNLLISDMA